MATCTNCSTIYSSKRVRCPQCGQIGPHTPSPDIDVSYEYDPEYDDGQFDLEPITGSTARAARERPSFRRRGTPSDEPAYIYATPKDRLVMPVSSFLGSISLMSIPVVGFIIQIIWAAGGAKNQNKRNLARAFLILTAIVSLLAFAAVSILFYAFGSYIDEFLSLLEIL